MSQNGYKLMMSGIFCGDRKLANRSVCATLESSGRIPLGAGDMIQWVKHLEGRWKDNSGIPRTHIDAT